MRSGTTPSRSPTGPGRSSASRRRTSWIRRWRGQRTAAETLARTAVGSAAGGFTGPDVERALREYQTALGATERAGTEGLSWDQALEAQRAWEDLMRSGSA